MHPGLEARAGRLAQRLAQGFHGLGPAFLRLLGALAELLGRLAAEVEVGIGAEVLGQQRRGPRALDAGGGPDGGEAHLQPLVRREEGFGADESGLRIGLGQLAQLQDDLGRGQFLIGDGRGGRNGRGRGRGLGGLGSGRGRLLVRACPVRGEEALGAAQQVADA